MAGYREHSYDPNAYERPGPVIRPFNWVQWTGVGVAAVGAVLAALYLLAKTGQIPPSVGKTGTAPFMLMLVGTTIMNSRRHPGTPIDEDQRARNRKMLIAVALICAAIHGIAVLIELLGA